MKTFILLIFFYLMGGATFSWAGQSYGDFHFVKFIKTTSANTFLADIPGSHPLLGKKIEILLKGIAVPNQRGSCKKERAAARKGMELISFLLKRCKDISLHKVERGRRFRLVATVLADGKDIRQILIAKGLAVNNVSKKSVKNWCH